MTSPPQSVRVHGAPQRQTWTYFTDTMHGMGVVFGRAPGMWRIRFAANKLEFFVCWKAMSVCMMLMVRCTTCAPVKPG